MSSHFLVWRQGKNKGIILFETIRGGISMATNRIQVMAEGMGKKCYKENLSTWKHSIFSLKLDLLTLMFFLYVRISLSFLRKSGEDR